MKSAFERFAETPAGRPCGRRARRLWRRVPLIACMGVAASTSCITFDPSTFIKLDLPWATATTTVNDQ